MRAMKRGLLVLVATVGLAGCRLAGAPPSELFSPSAVAPPSKLALPSASAVAGGPEAPEDCGFPPGTALEFAGRSTYAELHVGDAKGDSVDPLSDDPADIYITRDPITQEGWGPLGRFVCAIFVGENEGFVEITMHPEDWDRYSPVPKPGEPANGLTHEDAEAAARAALPEGDDWYVQLNGSGPIGDFIPDYQDYEWGRGVTADHWVWIALALRDNQSISLVLDFVDGTVIGTVEFTLDDCGRYEGDPEFGNEQCPDL
jgi:hypothetical protein